MYLVSIIIPVYNSKKYLRECLDSILMQEYKTYEVILVDDGSTDGSSEICMEFANNYNNFVYKKTKNMGVSAARNEGITIAKGQLICFVDSDDIIGKDYISGFIKCFSKYPNADMVCARYSTVIDDLNNNKKIEYTETDSISVISNNSGCYLFDKIFRKKIIEENGISFNTQIKMCEDMVFIQEYLKHSQSVVRADYIGYYYRNNNESASKKLINKNWFTIYDAFDILLKDIDNEELNYKYIYNLYRGKYRLKYIDDDGRIERDLNSRLSHVRHMVKKFSLKKRIKYHLYKHFWLILFSIKEKK